MTSKPKKILRSMSDFASGQIRDLYGNFDSPIASFDCGKKCAAHNPTGKPFCCDICHAVPAAYKSEWSYLKRNTGLWHKWRGSECSNNTRDDIARIKGDTPNTMLLLACLGPSKCQRDFRALSCRQFPFFPYVTSGYRFVGLSVEWGFESKCWVISNMSQVSRRYREEFVDTFDRIFALFQGEFDGYAFHSERMRNEFIKQKRRIPLLHRNGKFYLISPATESLNLISSDQLPTFGPYERV